MTISLNQVGKRYQHHWVFRGIDYTFESGKKYALLGANGSGKSTLLRVIAGMQNASKGAVSYTLQQREIPADHIYRSVSYCAPGMELVEEMTLAELLHFHFTFKQILPGCSPGQIIADMGLQDARTKPIHEFSSGMKQRVKLAQAFFCDSPLLLLDEPCSNLDQQGVDMYSHWLQQYSTGRLTIIASNDEREYEGVSGMLSMLDYK